MDKKLQDLKNDVYDLEYYIKRNNKEKVIRTLNDINKISKIIRREFKEGEEVLSDEVNDQQESIKYDVLNVLEFLYLPFNYKKEDSTDYIQRFSELRHETLGNTRALTEHNKFWEMHETIRGNVYGSLPSELIDEEKVDQLIKKGWEKTKVKILDFSSFTDNKNEIIKYCERNLDKFVIVKEKETKSILVLNYNF